MLTTSLVLASTLAFFADPGRAAHTPYGEVTIPFEVRRLPQTNVYYTIGHAGVPGPENQGHTSNAGFVVTQQGVVCTTPSARRR